MSQNKKKQGLESLTVVVKQLKKAEKAEKIAALQPVVNPKVRVEDFDLLFAFTNPTVYAQIKGDFNDR